MFRRVLGFRRLMKGGTFEAANSPDFSDAVKCAVIKGVPLRGYDTLVVSGTDGKQYRYWRYVAPKNRKCEVAEIGFLCGGKKLEVANAVSGGKQDASAVNAFDGNYYGVSVNAGIQGYAMSGVSHDDVSAYVDGKNVIRISGTVTYEYDDYPYGGLVVLKYSVTGSFSGGGSVTLRAIRF